MKAAIITGASVGIGRETARLFLEQDYQVYNLSRRACPLDGVNNISCDLADIASIEAACNELTSALAGAECITLIHNASQMRKDAADDCASDSLAAVLDTNVVAINSLNQALLPIMPEGSSLLYVGSTLSEKAVSGSFSYVISKHAQLGMMRATCQDLMGRGIHTALVCPGFTDTEMLRTHIGTDPETEQAIGSMNSFGRLIDPTEIAALLNWAHANPVINGAVLHANLGQKES
ncbi:short-chain dehydrogenase [Halioglobus japonicus]|uniref:SDR family NAD(P)-dependent oxidoreductase n=1 Tax=Halioglobus japonicus TaxID=930805 RepID=A0AAP8MGN4_9GAMM|nr:SDR family oxidoreductase [Halioglobus japonicus]AQA19861.1 short-chain dehydrogenase [Halioglobus japonicus]PLW87064.1 SDR family NAD(P)-dependent oxidoreductase [Halioglobus japonicus]GHD10400.1 3-hydroxyacyl-CoA dehydrogenase [Halioglobus japonicus]